MQLRMNPKIRRLLNLLLRVNKGTEDALATYSDKVNSLKLNWYNFKLLLLLKLINFTLDQ